jgi:hypothetical protein
MTTQTLIRIRRLSLWTAAGLLVSLLPTSAGSGTVLLPVYARQAINSAFPGARIVDFERQSEKGVRYYEVDVTWQARTMEVEVTEDGDLGEIQEDVDLETLPQRVLRALSQFTDRENVRKVEMHDIRGTPANGTFVTLPSAQIVYEIKARTSDGSHIAVRLDATGKVLGADDD